MANTTVLSEVIRDALELLEEHDHLNQRYFEKLKREVGSNNFRGEKERMAKNFQRTS